MPAGDIIILNGTSSAGKTAIATELQFLCDEPMLHSGIDHFLHAMPLRVFQDPRWCRLALDAQGRLETVTLGPNGRAFLCAAYRAIAEFARSGVSVLVEDVFYDREVLRCALETFAAFDPLLIGVRCRLDVAVARELRRGDRFPGGARTFFESAHANMEYDFEVDTSTIDARAAALAITEIRNKSRGAASRVSKRLDSEGQALGS